MPILSIDQFGNFYETDPDSSEGTGYKGMVPLSKAGDLSLGKAYSKSEAQLQANNNMMRYSQALHDNHKAKMGAFQREEKNRQRANHDMASAMQEDPRYRDHILKQGLLQAQNAEVLNAPVGLSGNGLSANGLYGELGEMTKEQIQRAMVMKGNYMAAAPVNPVEARTHALSKAIDKKLAIDTSNAQIAQKLGCAQMGTSPRHITGSGRRPARQNFAHPLAIHVVKA
jgi:hypothetical protein